MENRNEMMECIRNKPVVELTPEEIDMLTSQEQRWIWSYRAEAQRRSESEAG